MRMNCQLGTEKKKTHRGKENRTQNIVSANGQVEASDEIFLR